MKTYQRTIVVQAARIAHLAGPLVVTDDKDRINVGHTWMTHNTPKSGDYIVRGEEVGEYNLITAEEFEDYELMEEPPPTHTIVKGPVIGISITQALDMLRSDCDDDWTDAGLPSVKRIKELVNNPHITRSDISAANRYKVREI